MSDWGRLARMHDQALALCAQGEYVKAEKLAKKNIQGTTERIAEERERIERITSTMAEQTASARRILTSRMKLAEGTVRRADMLLASGNWVLGEAYRGQSRFDEAEDIFKNVIKVLNTTTNQPSGDFADFYRAYAKLLQQTNRESQAQEMEAEATRLLNKLYPVRSTWGK